MEGSKCITEKPITNFQAHESWVIDFSPEELPGIKWQNPLLGKLPRGQPGKLSPEAPDPAITPWPFAPRWETHHPGGSPFLFPDVLGSRKFSFILRQQPPSPYIVQGSGMTNGTPCPLNDAHVRRTSMLPACKSFPLLNTLNILYAFNALLQTV